MVKAKVSNQVTRVTAGSYNKETTVTSTNNPSQYWANVSEAWAKKMDGMVANEDYSAKYYATKAKEEHDFVLQNVAIVENIAETSIENINTIRTEAVRDIESAVSSIDTQISACVEELNRTTTEGVESIETTTVASLTNITNTVSDSLYNINTTITDGINTIETTKTEASEYVETTANESIVEVNQAKEQAIKDFNKASDKINYLFVMPIGTIGFSPFPIDETKGLRRILNGQIIIQEQFEGFVKWLKENIELYPQMACTEEEWQATVTMSVFGQCGKFVIDDEAGTIRLPKITGFIQGLTDLASLGELVEAGLPSISHTHTRGTMNITGSFGNGESYGATTGAFYLSGNQSGDTQTGGSTDAHMEFDASRSWTGATSTNSAVPAIYGKSTTVQPEAIRYPYFIQVATGAEESVDVTREIELNNPFFFGYYQYFEVAPNNISWLKSEGQWNSKAIYTDYYDWILTNANNGVANFKLSTDTYDDYAWVVNTADETFRLPIKTHNTPFEVTGAKTTLSMGAVSIKGNGKALGLTDGSKNAGLYHGSSGGLYASTGGYNANVGVAHSGDHLASNKYCGVTTDASKSGLTGSVTGTATTTVSTSENTNVSLYFYVGETTQNANLVNVGRIEEKLVDMQTELQTELPHKLNDTQITNCLLEVPQRIKYTLENGTLTIKAGSVVIVPYGTEDLSSTYPVGATFLNDNFKVYDTQFADGKFFVWAELVNDVSASRDTTDTRTRAINIAINLNELGAALNTSSGTSVNNSLYYNTTTNYIDFVDNSGVFSNNVYCLPIGLIIADGINAYSSISQVFNGIGYIGSTVWVDKGVKGLTAWGKNGDGTYKGDEYEVNTLEMVTYTRTNTATIYFGIDVNARNIHLNGNRYYDENANIIYNGTRAVNQFECGTVIYTSTGITAFNPKQPFKAVDYSDFANTPHIAQTYVNGTSWYRVWSDGWIEQGGYGSISSTTNITLLKKFSNTNYNISATLSGATGNRYAVQVVTSTKTASAFSIYCGHSENFYWMACGY